MKALRLPGWLETSVLARYQARASHLFLLHGNVRDLQPFGADYVPLPEGLKRLCAGREVLALYDVSSGLSFGSAAQEKAFRKALGFKGPLPSDPARALVLLDALVTSEKLEPGHAAVVLDYAHALAHDLPVGSGLIESGHRHVIQARIKKAGAWWTSVNVHAMCQLRALRANRQWDLYWSRN